MLKKAKRFLYLVHRWLGVALCLWFTLLFLSGVIMMYVEYPELTEEERLWQLEPLQPQAIQLSAAQAAAAVGAESYHSVTLSMLLGRPVYRLVDTLGQTVTLFADNGERFTGLQPEQAVRAAQHSAFAQHAGAVRHTGLVDIDQWTVSSVLDASRPLHRVALDDAAGTDLYLSAATGEVVRDTARNERFWNWLGSTVHWIYPWQFRQHADLWAAVLTYLSLAGVFSVVSGAVIGWWRLRVKHKYRGEHMTPFQGWQKWHHVLGLGFLLFISTWIFSGLMSMFPWGIFDNATSAEAQIARYTGGELDALERFPNLTAALLGTDTKEVRWQRIGSTHYLVLSRSATERTVQLPAGSAPLPELITAALPQLQPTATLTQRRAIDHYDSWYYSHHNRYRPLPALEVRFDDAEQSWYHIDLTTGAVVQRLTATDRWARWLYNGLHSLDFAALFQHRPLWDVLLILLLLCGTAFSLTAVVVGWRRLVPARR